MLVHRAYFTGGVGGSVLTTPPNMLVSVPVTGWGGPGGAGPSGRVSVLPHRAGSPGVGSLDGAREHALDEESLEGEEYDQRNEQ